VGPDIEREGPTRAESSDNSININVVSSDFIDYFVLVELFHLLAYIDMQHMLVKRAHFMDPFACPPAGGIIYYFYSI